LETGLAVAATGRAAQPAAAVNALEYQSLTPLAAGVLIVVLGIAWARLHAFLALVAGALVVGWLSRPGQFPDAVRGPHLVRALEQLAVEFGRTAGNIGIVIALASVIGLCLTESGAAERIVRRMLAAFGEKRAAFALLVSGFVLSIPVFFDTVFLLLVPLARALAVRTGGNFMLYVMAMSGGAAITHSLVPPTPGPLLVAEALRLNVGTAMLAGLLAGLLPALAVYAMAQGFNRRVPVPVRDIVGAPPAGSPALAGREEAAQPPFALAVLPVALPTGLIGLAAGFELWNRSPGWLATAGGAGWFQSVADAVAFLGNKNFALLLGAGAAMWVYRRQTGLRVAELSRKLAPAFETAGVIILITAAGGAFGGMLRHSGVSHVAQALAAGQSLNLVLLAWLATAAVRVAQGSATVAMITGSALMAAIIGDGAALPFHPIYIYLAVGFGSIVLSWMNDSGFWLVSRLCGFTEQETLRSWTLLETGISLVGLIETLLFSLWLPLK
jgi:GntP family gluconate:H+ symporter